MAKASKETTPTTMDFEIAEDRSCELEDFTVNFVTIRQDHDLAPMLASPTFSPRPRQLSPRACRTPPTDREGPT